MHLYTQAHVHTHTEDRDLHMNMHVWTEEASVFLQHSPSLPQGQLLSVKCGLKDQVD